MDTSPASSATRNRARELQRLADEHLDRVFAVLQRFDAGERCPHCGDKTTQCAEAIVDGSPICGA